MSSSSSSLNLDVRVLSHTLTTVQKLSIRTSLLKVKLHENLAHIAFWGRVTGRSADYFLAIAYDIGQAVGKRFYWRSDNNNRAGQDGRTSRQTDARLDTRSTSGISQGVHGTKGHPQQPPPVTTRCSEQCRACVCQTSTASERTHCVRMCFARPAEFHRSVRAWTRSASEQQAAAKATEPEGFLPRNNTRSCTDVRACMCVFRSFFVQQ